MKPVLGKNLRGKKAVSTTGVELGEVIDAYFELGGSLISLVIKPEEGVKEVRDYLDSNGLLNIPFEDVKAISKYVVVNFPK